MPHISGILVQHLHKTCPRTDLCPSIRRAMQGDEMYIYMAQDLLDLILIRTRKLIDFLFDKFKARKEDSVSKTRASNRYTEPCRDYPIVNGLYARVGLFLGTHHDIGRGGSSQSLVSQHVLPFS